MPTPLLKTETLGCKVNQYETQWVREGFLRGGYVAAEERQPADLCVVNTCTVTSQGDAKSRQVIRRLARENPTARIVVMGCYATRAPEEVARLPQVVEVVTDKREIPDLLQRWGMVDLPDGISAFHGHHRAFVKVQDGCLLRCSYCIIPQVRPHMESRSPIAIENEVRRLVDRGFAEIVLTGIHLGHYGIDWNQGRPRPEWIRLSDLLERLMRIPGDFRIRLSSLEATEVTRELLEVIASHRERICPHLHLCMQSGSDRVLRRMNRRWGAKRFLDRCLLARKALDDPALSTDIIVGFPGETEEDFQATCRLAREVGFMKLHLFPFSPRRGTPAADYSDQVSPADQEARMDVLRELDLELRNVYGRRQLGREVRILVEGIRPDDPDRIQGTTCRYLPLVCPGSIADKGRLITSWIDAFDAPRGRWISSRRF